MILLAILLGGYLTRRFKLGWRLWWVGGASFIISQIGHIPFNQALTVLFQNGIFTLPEQVDPQWFNALILGLSSGFWEEVVRYASYRWWIKKARSWAKGLVFGAGWGGMEAIVVGSFVLITMVVMLVLGSGLLSGQIPKQEQELLAGTLETYWSVPWYENFIGVLERSLTMIIQIALSILVLQVFLRKQILWLIVAMGWHSLVNAGAVLLLEKFGVLYAETWIGVCALVSLGIIFYFKESEPALDKIEPGEELDNS
jgi:uncharacterized membrane protein YhfC